MITFDRNAHSLADGGLSAPICGITTTRSGRTGLFPDGNAGWAEVAFGAVDATADLKYDGRIVFVRWSGFDEGDKISPDGSVELQADGSVKIALSFEDGDDTVLTARRE
jgi:hypothetical protein